jgi:hypothetical protein
MRDTAEPRAAVIHEGGPQTEARKALAGSPGTRASAEVCQELGPELGPQLGKYDRGLPELTEPNVPEHWLNLAL